MEICVVGGGYAGVVLAQSLESRLPQAAHVYLIDDSGVHELKHEIHRIVRDPTRERYLRFSLNELFSKTTIVRETVEDIDPDSPRVRCADGRTFDPTYIAICIGASQATGGIPGATAHARSLGTIDDARGIRGGVQSLQPNTHISIVGAGLSGVQLAGELAELREDITVVLYEQADYVAPTFPQPFRGAIRQQLEQLGVRVVTSAEITGVDTNGLTVVDGEFVEHDLCVWTGGLSASSAVGSRPQVPADLRWTHSTFVVGDAARVVDSMGRSVPASAKTAIEQADVCARNIDRLVRCEDDALFPPRLDRYKPGRTAWAVSVGDEAVALVGDTVVTGAPAQLIKATATARYLTRIGRPREAAQLGAIERPSLRSTLARWRGPQTRCWPLFDG